MYPHWLKNFTRLIHSLWVAVLNSVYDTQTEKEILRDNNGCWNYFAALDVSDIAALIVMMTTEISLAMLIMYWSLVFDSNGNLRMKKNRIGYAALDPEDSRAILYMARHGSRIKR
ncbi:hypothetical protein HYFRA_00006653 [Hymenoscyphus fraxineus]|uniref:Uncharacterized protein n=1 Tax=Hymenoscyphus fraxineus TaxID=746836 RepID=A0A9N9KXF9_9HELO|nr:hypothetical protein HYFRA_00006653 [Hymenoscyphus fraxineus]